LIELVPATQKHVEEFYGKMPIRSVRAVVGLLDGKVVGIAGVFLDRNHVVAFSEMKEEARRYKKTILRAGYMVYDIMQKYNVVFAVANPQEKGARRLMARFGFRFVEINSAGEEVYQWHN
jgi:hypothetical protein